MRIPKVAIITRTKDRPIFLDRAIESVIRQSFEDWVHVIVNDGGDQTAVDLLVECHKEAYAGRVITVHNGQSIGMQNASNAGLEASDSEYVVVHDDDDSWYPDFLEKTVGYLEAEGPESTVQGVVCQSTQMLEEINLVGAIIELGRNPYHPFEFVSLDELRKHNLFPPIAFLYRRSVHDTIGTFRQVFDVLGDFDFNLRFLRRYDLAVLPTFHAFYHWRHGSQANTVTRQLNHHRDMHNRMKNAYAREARDDPQQAVGTLEHLQLPAPKPFQPPRARMRTEDPPQPEPLPDLRDGFAFEVLSLDVFDTLLRRRCHHPLHVFQLLEQRAVADLDLPSKPYAIARRKAEVLARERIRPEVTFEEIHSQLAELLNLDADQSTALADLELTIEKEMLYADPRWVALYNTYRGEGIRIIFVSDMYHSADVIRGFLENCGFEDPKEIFVSCEWQATKHDGTLFKRVTEQLDIEPGTILHVGDNFHSDYLHGWGSRWQALHWGTDFDYRPLYRQAGLHLNDPTDFLSTRIMGEVHRLGLVDPLDEEDFFTKLGREIAGPLYLAYMLWVVRSATEKGLRKLILVGRDGHYWEKTLNLLSGSRDLGIEYQYLHASRKVFHFASFTELDQRAIKFLSIPNPSLRVRDFVDRTGLSSEACLRQIEQAGFEDPDAVLTTDLGGAFLDNRAPVLLQNLFILLKAELEALFAEDREGFTKALRETNFDPDDCALIDIGWSGSSVRALAHMLDLDEDQQLHAYFFGTWSDAKPLDTIASFDSFFMHLGEPLEQAHLLRESINLIEILHSAPFPTLLAFEHEGPDVVPVFAEQDRSGLSRDGQTALWTGAESFLRGIIESGLPDPGEGCGRTYIHLVLHRLLREPSPLERSKLGELLHSEGFGLEVYKPLVFEVLESASEDELMAAYKASNWKRGFMASVTQDQRNTVTHLLNPKKVRSTNQLENDLKWQTAQTTKYWKEAERLKEAFRWQREQTDKFWIEAQQLKADLQNLNDSIHVHNESSSRNPGS